MSTIARWYQSDRNPEGASIPGVPLGDIEDDVWARMPAWKQADIDAWQGPGGKVYRATHRILPPVVEREPEPEPEEAVLPDEPPLEEGRPTELLFDETPVVSQPAEGEANGR